MDSRKWELTGPAADLLTRSQTARYLGIGVRTLDRLVAAGQFPRPRRIGSKAVWTGEDVAAYRQLAGRFEAGDYAPPREDEDDD